MKVRFDKQIEEGYVLSKTFNLEDAYFVNDDLELGKFYDTNKDELQIGDVLKLISFKVNMDFPFEKKEYEYKVIGLGNEF